MANSILHSVNTRPIQATIHTDALRHNLLQMKGAAGDARIWAVVKANAYGHGIEHVFEGLRGADGFACLDLTEAQLLRSLGWRGPLLLLEGAFNARDLDWCSRLSLWHVVHCAQQIDWLSTHKTHEPHRVFLKLNSGMNRLGFKPEQYRAAYIRLSALSQVAEVSHLTHFSDADSATPQGEATVRSQRQIFEAASQDLDGEGSLGNSAATLRFPNISGDWVRAGVGLYGSAPDYPAKNSMDWGLLPAMTLSSQIVGVQHLVAGDRVGYGSTFTAPHPMRVGIVACGYADGYPRHASNNPHGAPVLVNGRRSRTLGRISMDMLTVNLTDLPDADLRSTVTLWGAAPTGELLAIDEVAAAAGTISYELMCAVAARVPKGVSHAVD